MNIGDWVQAKVQIIETEEQGAFTGPDLIHAEQGGIGHVLEVIDSIMVNVFWERTGTVTLVDVEQLERLGDASTGRGAV